MKKVVIAVLILISLIFSIRFAIYSAIGQIKHAEIDKTDEALGINEVPEQRGKTQPEAYVDKKRQDIVSIMLFGLDGRQYGSNSRSDTMMILTVDFKNNKIKLSSLMRDMYVDIEGYGKTKLNHAYAYGGAPLALKTINQNFGTDIRDYAMANFLTFEKIIDVLGGVTVDIKEDEIPYINENISCDTSDITNSGEQLLNGNQAVSYARIRYLGNGDFDRTNRQRKIIAEIIDKAKEKGVTAVPTLISEVLSLVETSMDKQTILNLAIDIYMAGDMTLEQERFPIDGYCWNYMNHGIYYLKFDTENTKKQLNDFIYYDTKPIAKK